MTKKLKYCQKVRVIAYNYQWLYLEGDKLCYQHQDTNGVCGSLLVLGQCGNSVWVHASGDISKVAACKVKPYELPSTDDDYSNEGYSQVMTEDTLLDEVKKDAVGKKYLNLKKSEYFDKSSILIVKLSVSEEQSGAKLGRL